MSPKLPAVTPQRLVSVLERRGFVKVRQSGRVMLFLGILTADERLSRCIKAATLVKDYFVKS